MASDRHQKKCGIHLVNASNTTTSNGFAREQCDQQWSLPQNNLGSSPPELPPRPRKKERNKEQFHGASWQDVYASNLTSSVNDQSANLPQDFCDLTSPKFLVHPSESIKCNGVKQRIRTTPRKKDEDGAIIEQRNKLFKKMKETQARLASMREQEAALLSLQKSAENKLAEARTMRDALLVAEQDESARVLHNSHHSPCNQGPSERVMELGQHNGYIDSMEGDGSENLSHVYSANQNKFPDSSSEHFFLAGGLSSGHSASESVWKEDVNKSYPCGTAKDLAQLQELQKQLQHLREFYDFSRNTEALAQCESHRQSDTKSNEVVAASDRQCQLRHAAQKKPDNMFDSVPCPEWETQQFNALSQLQQKKMDAVADAAFSEWQCQQLEDKLRRLQSKKQQMDNLLLQLSNFQSIAEKGNENMHQTEEFDSCTEIPSRDAESVPLTESSDAKESSRELEFMATLQQLRAMLENMQASFVAQKPLLPSDQVSDKPQEDNMTRRLLPSSRKLEQTAFSLENQRYHAQPKKDNTKLETSSAFPARRHYEAEGRANEDADIAATAAVPSAPQSSSENAADSDTDDIIQQFQLTREKLGKLQNILRKTQLQENAKNVPSDYSQIPPALTDRAEDSQAEQGLKNDDLNTFQAKVSHVNGGSKETLVKPTREENHVQKQREKPQDLNERSAQLRARAQELQAKLQVLNIVNNVEQRGAESGIHQKGKPCQQQQLFTQPVMHSNSTEDQRSWKDNVTSNSLHGISAAPLDDSVGSATKTKLGGNRATKENVNSLPKNLAGWVKDQEPCSDVEVCNITGRQLEALNADLNRSLSLRNELKKQKAVLEELLHQERIKQLSYSLNQDIHSQSGSSVKSDPVEGSSSLLAADATIAATWGGSSTQENFEEIEAGESGLDEGSGSESEAGGEVGQVEERKMCGLPHSFAEFSGTEAEQPISATRTDNQLGSHSGSKGRSGPSAQWMPVKNFQNVEQNMKHLQGNCDTTYQENLTTTSLDGIPEQPDISHLGTAADNHSSWQQQLQQQLENTSSLCQSILRDQKAITSRFMSSSLATSGIGHHTSRGGGEFWPHYAQQIQQQQQLLLSLSHCYHILHLQQLEILQLQRCLHQCPDAESIQQQPLSASSQGAAPEDFMFHPCFGQSVPHTPHIFHNSPGSAAFIQQFPPGSYGSLNTAAFNPYSNTSRANNATAPNFCQESRGVTEALNNQVPPGTRANNFWDNFRSYSRQNLLSTSSTLPCKSNELLGGDVTAMNAHLSSLPTSIRSHNTASRMSVQRSRESLQLHVDNTEPSSVIHTRSQNHPVTNLQHQELIARPSSKKTNFVKSQHHRAARDSIRADVDLHHLINEAEQVVRPDLDHALQGQAANAHSKQGITYEGTATVSPAREPVNLEPEAHDHSYLLETTREALYSEMCRLMVLDDKHLRLFLEMLRQLKQFGSMSQWLKAIALIRNVASLPGDGDWASEASLCSQTKEIRQRSTSLPKEACTQTIQVSPGMTWCHASGDASPISTSHSLPWQHHGEYSESSQLQSTDQVTARAPKTVRSLQAKSAHHMGAIKKRPRVGQIPSLVPQSTALQPFIPQVSSANSMLDQLQVQVEHAIMELVPFLHHHLEEDCTPQLQAKLRNRMIGALQPSTSPTFIHQLAQSLQEILAKYTGRRIQDCEKDLVVEITDMALRELTLYKMVARKSESTGTSSAKPENEEPAINLSKTALTKSPFAARENSQVYMPTPPTTIHAGHEVARKKESESMPENKPDPENSHRSDEIRIATCSGSAVEEDLGYQGDSGGSEAENEVEAGAEMDDTKDLAEADQSTNQLGAIASGEQPAQSVWQEGGFFTPPSVGSISVSMPEIGRVMQEHECLMNGEPDHIEDGARSVIPVHPDHVSDVKAENALDDVPTKLIVPYQEGGHRTGQGAESFDDSCAPDGDEASLLSEVDSTQEQNSASGTTGIN